MTWTNVQLIKVLQRFYPDYTMGGKEFQRQGSQRVPNRLW